MVYETIKGMLADQLGVDADTISMDSDIASDLGADSLDVVELIMSIEDEFDFEVPDDAIETIKTVGDLVKYIEARA